MSWHIITAAGMAWPQAFYYGMCILEEMQWIRTRPVHASDFFHGTLELVEPGVSVILLKGEDEYRQLADRVGAFAAEKTDELTVIDMAGEELAGSHPPPGRRFPDRARQPCSSGSAIIWPGSAIIH